MATKQEIVSRAAIKLDANPISNFETDQTREAEVFRTLYDGVKESELSNYFWNFNLFNFELNRTTNTPVNPNWQYEFTAPPDMVRIISVMDKSGSSIGYEDATGRIYTREKEAICKYQRNLTEDSYPAYFVDVLVVRLAYEAAIPLSGRTAVIQQFATEYENKLRNAKRVDAQSNPPQRLIAPENSPWVQAHQGSSRRWWNGQIIVPGV